jgi:hypothetical protein
MPKRTSKINRRIKVNIEGVPEYESRIRYLDSSIAKIIPPVDEDGNSMDINKGTEVVITELTNSGENRTYRTIAQFIEPDPVTGFDMLVVAQDMENPIPMRNFARVLVDIPVKIRTEYGRQNYEGTALNISGSGMLISLGLENEGEIPKGAEVMLEFKLPEKEEFAIPAQIVRIFRMRPESNIFGIGVSFKFTDFTLQDKIVSYVLTRQIELHELEIPEVQDPLVQQITMLKEEVARLREELRLAHQREAQLEEARRRSDAIIMQLTRQLEEQTRQLNRLRLKASRSWWKFWTWFRSF